MKILFFLQDTAPARALFNYDKILYTYLKLVFELHKSLYKIISREFSPENYRKSRFEWIHAHTQTCHTQTKWVISRKILRIEYATVDSTLGSITFATAGIERQSTDCQHYTDGKRLINICKMKLTCAVLVCFAVVTASGAPSASLDDGNNVRAEWNWLTVSQTLICV